MVKVTLGDVGLVVTAEHTNFELGDLVLRRSLCARRLKVGKILIDDVVGVDVLGDIGSRLLVRDKLLRRSEIDTILKKMLVLMMDLQGKMQTYNVRIDDGRSTAGKDDLAGTGLTSHAHNLPTGSSTNNGVIHEQDDTVLELGLHGAELSPDALLSGLLTGQNEGTVDVTVLDKTVREGFPKLL